MNDDDASRSNQIVRASHHSIVCGVAAYRNCAYSGGRWFVQGLDETTYWLELLADAGVVTGQKLQALMGEANELISILVASVKTIKRRRR
jgi:hypothetical protein